MISYAPRRAGSKAMRMQLLVLMFCICNLQLEHSLVHRGTAHA